MASRTASFRLLPAGFLVIAFVVSFDTSTTTSSSFSSHADVDLEALSKQRDLATRMAHEAIASAGSWARASMAGGLLNGGGDGIQEAAQLGADVALADCASLYEDSELRLRRLVVPTDGSTSSDARTWLSAAMTGHATCMDGLRQLNVTATRLQSPSPTNTMDLLRRALAMHALSPSPDDPKKINNGEAHSDGRNNTAMMFQDAVQLASWDAFKNYADVVVAQDGSGDYKAVNDAVASIKHRRQQGRRLVIYIKSGVYKENVVIDRNMKDIMFVGDGIGKTIITGSRSVQDGFTTRSTATLSVSGDNFWGRDMTFENTAGPQKHQAVAAMVASDHSVFYRCSFRGYQDTLYVHSLRQLYRDCRIYGTIDFVFGNAAAVVQNCDIFVRKPMDSQSNMITAQGRDNENQNTGISIHRSRVLPDSDFKGVKGSYRSYLGRPWKKYSRAVFLETNLDGMINPEGWAKWRGSFALDTLFYGEYMNAGEGASTERRVNWPGFHVLSDSEANQFTVESFIEGNYWIPESGVPFWSGL